MSDDGLTEGTSIDEDTSPLWKPVVSVHSSEPGVSTLGSIPRVAVKRRVVYKKKRKVDVRQRRDFVPRKTRQKIHKHAEAMLQALDACAQTGPDMIREILRTVNIMLSPPLDVRKLKEMNNDLARMKTELQDLQEEKDDMMRELVRLQSEVFHLEDDREDELRALRDAANAVRVTTSPSASPAAPAFGSWAREINRKNSHKGDSEKCKDCGEVMTIANRWCPISGARHKSEAEKEVEALRRRLSAIALEELSKGFIADGSIMCHSDVDSPEPSPRRMSRQWLIDSVTLASPLTIGDRSTPDSRLKHTIQFVDCSDVESNNDDDSMLGAVFRKLSKKSSSIGESPPHRPLAKSRPGGNIKRVHSDAGDSPAVKPLTKVGTMPLADEGISLERKLTEPTLQKKATMPTEGEQPMLRVDSIDGHEREPTVPRDYGLERKSTVALERKETMPTEVRPLLRNGTFPAGVMAGGEIHLDPAPPSDSDDEPPLQRKGTIPM